MDIQKYWLAVNETISRLPPAPVYYLTSLSTPDGGKAGVIIDVADRKQAAQLLVANSHRLATPDEVEQFAADEKSERGKLAALEMGRKQHFAMPPELTTLLAALANQQTDKPKKEK